MAETATTRLTDLGSSMSGYQALDNADNEGDTQDGKKNIKKVFRFLKNPFERTKVKSQKGILQFQEELILIKCINKWFKNLYFKMEGVIFMQNQSVDFIKKLKMTKHSVDQKLEHCEPLKREQQFLKYV